MTNKKLITAIQQKSHKNSTKSCEGEKPQCHKATKPQTANNN